jgi:hypothetical protein
MLVQKAVREIKIRKCCENYQGLLAIGRVEFYKQVRPVSLTLKRWVFLCFFE